MGDEYIAIKGAKDNWHRCMNSLSTFIQPPWPEGYVKGCFKYSRDELADSVFWNTELMIHECVASCQKRRAPTELGRRILVVCFSMCGLTICSSSRNRSGTTQLKCRIHPADYCATTTNGPSRYGLAHVVCGCVAWIWWQQQLLSDGVSDVPRDRDLRHDAPSNELKSDMLQNKKKDFIGSRTSMQYIRRNAITATNSRWVILRKSTQLWRKTNTTLA